MRRTKLSSGQYAKSSFETTAWFYIFLQKSRNHLQTVGTREVRWSKFHTEDTQLWNDPWTSLSWGYFCSVRAKLFVRKEDHDNYSENIRRNLPNFNIYTDHPPDICVVPS